MPRPSPAAIRCDSPIGVSWSMASGPMAWSLPSGRFTSLPTKLREIGLSNRRRPTQPRSSRRCCGANRVIGTAKESGYNLPLPLHIIPYDIAVEVFPGGEEDAPFRALGQAIGEADVLLGLRPARHEENVDRDSLAGREHSFPHRRRLGERVGRIEHVEPSPLKMGRRQ